MVPIMKIVFPHVIIHQTSNIILGQRAIHVAHQELIIISVEVDLCLQSHILDLILNDVFPEFQVKSHQVIGAQLHWMDIAILIDRKFNMRD